MSTVFQLIYTLQPYKEQHTELLHLDLNSLKHKMEDFYLGYLHNNQDRQGLLLGLQWEIYYLGLQMV
jgi:hypothetical protein